MEQQQPSLAELSCQQLRGVGSRIEKLLNKAGIHTLHDLLFHLPLRYQDRTRVTPIRDIRVGDDVVVEGLIQTCQITFARRRLLVCQIHDSTQSLTLQFFNFSQAQKNKLAMGTRIRCYGQVRQGYRGGYLIIHPEYQYVDEETVLTVDETLTPIYPSTDGLSQQMLRQLTAQVLALLQQGAWLPECFPEPLREKFQLASLQEAVQFVHRPPPDATRDLLEEGKHPMQQRLAFEELVAHQIVMLRLRAKIQRQKAYALKTQQTLLSKFYANLTFTLTHAQARVIKEIQQDLQKPIPMLRLVQGDVGCGKTIVAICTILQAVEAGYQAAIMAPTEILAEQHYRNFCDWLTPLSIRVTWLSGKLTAKQRQQPLAHIASGETQVIVGTHALFQKQVEFFNLALVVVDEQHRFGVHQRLALVDKAKEKCVHQLVMTATPIPRTLAMIAYADLDLSIIDELPPGRQPINTVVVDNQRRDKVIARVHEVCSKKNQAYWVCTLVEESEMLQCKAVDKTAEQLAAALPDLKVMQIHGRMKPTEKEAIMLAFKAGDIDVLVATTVIEVGVDVPNANLMIIENPERLGLAQLHQLRGRVGRGQAASHCVLLYQAPLSEQARQRLGILRETQDGFIIAKRDLAIRGPGEMLGTKQTGMARFRVANIIRDKPLLTTARQAAQLLLQHHQQCANDLVARWLAENELYATV
jgi:ATP-dependent DNA helicase RecG